MKKGELNECNTIKLQLTEVTQQASKRIKELASYMLKLLSEN